MNIGIMNAADFVGNNDNRTADQRICFVGLCVLITVFNCAVLREDEIETVVFRRFLTKLQANTVVYNTPTVTMFVSDEYGVYAELLHTIPNCALK